MYKHKKGYPADDVYKEELVDYTDTRKVLEIERRAIEKGDRILIVDDWFERGAQGHAVIKLVEKAGGRIIGISIVVDDMDDKTRTSFDSYNLQSLVHKPD